MNRRRRNKPRSKHVIETEFEITKLYLDLLKNEKYWRNNGQYFIAKQYELKAKLLLGLYCPTKKLCF